MEGGGLFRSALYQFVYLSCIFACSTMTNDQIMVIFYFPYEQMLLEGIALLIYDPWRRPSEEQ